MYKDKEKQRRTDAERQRRYRASRGVTSQNVTKAVTSEGPTSRLTPERDKVGTKLHYENGGFVVPDVLNNHNVTVLHPAIIATNDRLTTNPNGTVDKQARTNRMANAHDYERKFPGRPYTGV